MPAKKYYQKNREKYNQESKDYYQKNKENKLDYQKKYRKDNLDSCKESVKKCKDRTFLKNREKKKEYSKEYGKRYIAKHAKNVKVYREKNTKKIKAQQLANQIPLKKSCEICNSENNLQRHHWNYDKPLLVNTLCGDCHSIQHITNFKNKFMEVN